MSFGGAAKCPKCGKAVYFAEEAVAAGKKWHKFCLKCEDCNKMLDSFTMKDHEGVLYCGTCHGKRFGLSGYGYGGGAGVLNTEGAVGSKPASQTAYVPAGSKGGASRFGSTDKCPRCGKTVYIAEKVVGAGSSWHKSCFNCKNCNKKLDSTTVSDKDGEIYCKGCYGKEFGPKGYGYGGGAGALTMTK